MVEYKTDGTGRRRRVHREYVDVITRCNSDGSLAPLCVCWRDGRSFRIDEVVEQGTFGAKIRGRSQARWRVRFGSHETDLYLERVDAAPSQSEGQEFRWWVFAYDTTKPGHDPKREKED